MVLREGSLIMISKNERDLSGALFEPGGETLVELLSEANGRVEEVAGDEELLGSGFIEEVDDAIEVGFVISLGDGEAVGAKGGGFAEVNIGKNES